MADPQEEKTISERIEELPECAPPDPEEDMPLTPGAATWRPGDPVL